MKNTKFILLLLTLTFISKSLNATVFPYFLIKPFKPVASCTYVIGGKPFGFITNREPATVIVTINGQPIAYERFESRSQSFRIPINVTIDNIVATVTTRDMRITVDGQSKGGENGTFNVTFNVGGQCVAN